MTLQRGTIAACLFVAACGGGGGGGKPPVKQPEPEPAPSAFKDMNEEQRADFMKTVVLPQMKELFVAFDPKFDAMDCKTCHGDGVAAGTFEMPNPKLPVLPGTEEAFGEYVKDPEHARWSQFMIGQVKPKMAELLQVDEFDPATGTGEFSCANCHTLEGH
jgi:hypothetical protein